MNFDYVETITKKILNYLVVFQEKIMTNVFCMYQV